MKWPLLEREASLEDLEITTTMFWGVEGDKPVPPSFPTITPWGISSWT